MKLSSLTIIMVSNDNIKHEIVLTNSELLNINVTLEGIDNHPLNHSEKTYEYTVSVAARGKTKKLLK